MNFRLSLRRIAARLSPAFGFGRCRHCGLPWYIVEGHVLYYGHGALILTCGWCWTRTTPDQRIGYLNHLLRVTWALDTTDEKFDHVYSSMLKRHIWPDRSGDDQQ